MLLVPAKALKAGMRLAQPITHPRRDDFIVLERGYVLNDDMIERMRELRIGTVWVDFPTLHVPDDRIRERMLTGHAGLWATMQPSLDWIRSRLAVDMNLGLYRRAVEGWLFEAIVDHENEHAILPLSSSARDLAGHLSKVAYLSLLLGANLTGYLRTQRANLPSHLAEDTRRLGLGALLHDVGKLEIDAEFRTCSIFDAEAASSEYRDHTLAGYEAVLGRIPGTAATVVLNHHQRFNGSGFPDRFNRLTKTTRDPPSGERIHIFSRIVGVADAFDRLMSKPGASVSPVEALHALYGPGLEGWFDPFVVDALAKLAPPFPIGMAVQLNNGREAFVTAHHPNDPCRPTIKLLDGPVTERGRHAVRGVVDLRRTPELSIELAEGQLVAPFLFRCHDLEPVALF